MNIVLLEWRPYSSLFQRNNLGLQYIASSLREAGHVVHIDVFEGETIDNVCNKVLSYNPDIVGMPVFPATKNTVYSIIDNIKQANPNITIISGGHTATLYAAKILKEQKNIEIIIYGESELTYVDLCERMEKEQSLEDCKGIFYRKNGYIYRTSPREQIEDLDVLPFPVNDVTEALNDKTSPTVFTSISTSRGCLGNCDFCVSHRVSKIIKRSRWRGRSPKGMMEELEHIKESFPDKRLVVEFVDSSFEDPDPRGKKRIREFLDLLEASKMKIAFSFLTRAESWSNEDEELIRRMKKLGLFRVSPGFESGSDASLISFGKRASVENNYKVFELFSKNGVSVCGLVIMFHPYVTFKDLRHNASFLSKVGLSYSPQSWLHSLYVFPDTRIFKRIANDGLLLGTDDSGFEYSYLFEDGRMRRLHSTIEKLTDLESVKKYENTCEKLSYELKIYEVWREQFKEFEKVTDEMAIYREVYESTTDFVGNRLHDTFLDLVDAAEYGTIENIENEVISEWDKLLGEKHVVLEHEWMRCRMKLLRKGIQLL